MACIKHHALIATLQMVNYLCDVAISLCDAEVKNLSWTTFVSGVNATNYPELLQYFKERRLYVNDAVAAEEDV